ncbi:hypothetical protein Ancab_014679 [Ancistrocladus abbreviatus]
MEKLTTHTSDYLGIPNGVWPTLGGARSSSEGVVRGLINTRISPDYPSFAFSSSLSSDNKLLNHSRFRRTCAMGVRFFYSACYSKIVGAQYLALRVIVASDFNATRDYASPFDVDGHGSHTTSIATSNNGVPAIVNGYNYGFASGMAPGPWIATYKELYTFGGYISDVVAAVDQVVEDGVDILSLFVGLSTVPPGPASFLNVLEMQLLFATRAGVVVIQAAENGGPFASSILSFSPWITSVAASVIDHKYNGTLILGNGQSYSGIGLAHNSNFEIIFVVHFIRV